MKRLRSPKVCAALVMIAWLASLVSLWGFEVAGNRGIAQSEQKNCSVKDLKAKSVQLEMASDRDDVLTTLNGDSAKAECIRRGKTAEVAYADSFFLVTYSLLTLALFLFVRALRMPPASPDNSSLALLALGVLLALTMAIGDFVENRHLIEVIRLAGEANPPLDQIDGQLPGLQMAAFVKMGALALSALILGALWPFRSRWVWMLRLFGFAAAALFIAAMLLDLRKEVLEISCMRQVEDWEVAGYGMIAFAAFAFTALIQAVATMADGEQYAGDSKS
jgi:hypothetical protein